MTEKGDSILSEAEEAVLEGRVEVYGEPKANWQKIAALWSAYLNRPIEPEQACDMMMLVKLGRKASGKPDTDHNRDIAGYALIAEMLEQRGENTAKEAAEKLAEEIGEG